MSQRIRLLAVVFALVTGLPGPGTSAAQKPAPWLDVPADWSRTVQNGVLALMPGDLPAGRSLVLLVELPTEFPGALRADYDDALESLGPWRPVESPKDQPFPNGWVFRMGVGVTQVEGKAHTALVVAARRGPVRARFWVLADTDETYNRYKGVFLNAISSVQDLTDSPASPDRSTSKSPAAVAAPRDFREPKPIAGLGTGLTGVWVGLERGAAASASSTSGIDLSSRWEMYVFLSDGTWTRRPPLEGLDHADIEALRSRLSGFFGRYTVSGTSVRLETSNRIVSAYQWSGSRLEPTGTTSGSGLTRVDTGVGLTFAGTYARSDITTRDFPGDSLPVLTFGTDGRFVDRNAGVRTVFSGSTDAYNAAGRGRYFIANNSLYLIYDDGRKKMMAFALLPKAGDQRSAPSWLLVGQRWMTRR